MGAIRSSLQAVADGIDGFKGVVARGGPVNWIMPVNNSATGSVHMQSAFSCDVLYRPALTNCACDYRWELNDEDMATHADLAAVSMKQACLLRGIDMS